MRQVFYYSLILIATIAIVSGCKKTQEPLPILHVGHAPHDHHSPLYVAAMKPDHFKNNGGIYHILQINLVSKGQFPNLSA